MTPSDSLTPVEGDADFDATAVDYRLAPLMAIGLLAVRYIKRAEKEWQATKWSGETDDDLDPSWRTFRDGVLRLAALSTTPHPGEQHEFRTNCRRCGEPGMLNISLIAPDETITIAPRLAPNDPE